VDERDEHPRMSAARTGAVVAAALVAGAVVVALELSSDHRDARVVWAVFGPTVVWSFVGTGLYVLRRRPEHRIGVLMILLGFAWFLFTLDAANSRLVYTFALVTGGLWGAVYVVATGYWHSAQPDSFAVLPLILALLAYEQARRRSRRGTAFVAGLLLGFCAQLRPVILLLPAVLVLWDLAQKREHGASWRAVARSAAAERTLALLLGGGAFTALTLLWLALHGALGEYFYAQLDFASEYARRGGPYSPQGLTIGAYLSGLRSGTMFIAFARTLLVAPALVAIVVGGLVRRDHFVLLVGWLALAAYAGVAMQGKYFLYHWHTLLPLLSLLGGWTAAYVWRELRRAGRGLRFAAATLAALAAALLLLTPDVTDRGVHEWSGFVQYYHRPDDRGDYYDRFGLYGRGTFSYRASEEVAAYLRARTRPGDGLFIWGYDPLLFVETGLNSPSRFLSFLPLISNWTPHAWHDEFVDDLERSGPAYIVVQRNENAPWITGHNIEPQDFIQLIPRFQALLQRDYELEHRIEDYWLYRRR